MSKTFRVSGEMLARQQQNASEIMQRYIAFAKSIGCTVQGDEIACTAKQSKLLSDWWGRNAKGPVT